MAHNTPPESRLPNMPEKRADVDEYLAYLVSGIDLIMTKSEGDISPIEYTHLYTTVYNYCTSARRITTGNRKRGRHHAAELYHELNNYFAEYIHPLMEKSEGFQDVDLLRYYASEWDRFTKNVGRLSRVFSYIDRREIEINPRENEENEENEGAEETKRRKKDVYRISTLALTQWKAYFLAHLQQDNAKLTNTILRLIAQQRGGGQIDEDLVKKVLQSFVLLGLDNSNPNKECLDFYRDQFETAFLQHTEDYYKEESRAFVTENTVSDYLKKVEERLREEAARAESYLHTSTRKSLLSTCKNVLIRGHAELMWESFQSWLALDRDDDLQRVYGLLSRIPEGLEPLRRRFEGHVKQAGLSAISKLIDEGGANAELLDPKAYVDTLLGVHRRNSEIVQRCFGGETGFSASLDRACREFVNRNAATGSSPTKSGELIAKHLGMLVLSDRMVEEDVIRVVVLVNYIEDKSVFQAFYTGKLSKYLAHHVSGPAESQTSTKPEVARRPEPQEIVLVEVISPAGITSQPEAAPGTQATNIPTTTSQPMVARDPDASGPAATRAPYVESHQESARPGCLDVGGNGGNE